MNNELRDRPSLMAIIAVLAVGWSMGARAETPVKTTATTICQAFKDNEVAAEGKYKEKTLEVTGKVQRVYETTKPH